MHKYSISFKKFNICEVEITEKELLEMEYSQLINKMRLKSQIRIDCGRGTFGWEGVMHR